MKYARSLVIVLGAGTAAVAIARHLRGAAIGHRLPGGILIGDAAAYDSLSRLLLAPFYRSVAAEVAAHASADTRILDVGCGPGNLALQLARRYGLAVTGLDLDPAMIARAHANADRLRGGSRRPTFRVGDVTALPFPDGSFELVVSTLSLHHWADPAAGLAEIGRVLAPGGRLLLVDLRRPNSSLGRALLTLTGHGGARVGVQSLPPLLAAAGFAAPAVGTLGHGTLGYVRASIASPSGASTPPDRAAPPAEPTNTRPHDHAIFNRVIPPLLRSPLHRLLSENLLLLTYTGRKTGRDYTFPVTYLQTGGTIVVFSDQRWWRNLRGGARVTLLLRGRAARGVAVPVEDREAVARAVAQFLARKGRRAASMINVRLAPGASPTAAALAAATRRHVAIRITLDPPDGGRPTGRA